jgi:hypothetical protein
MSEKQKAALKAANDRRAEVRRIKRQLEDDKLELAKMELEARREALVRSKAPPPPQAPTKPPPPPPPPPPTDDDDDEGSEEDSDSEDYSDDDVAPPRVVPSRLAPMPMPRYRPYQSAAPQAPSFKFM